MSYRTDYSANLREATGATVSLLLEANIRRFASAFAASSLAKSARMRRASRHFAAAIVLNVVQSLRFPVADRSFLVANAQQGLCHIIYCSDGFCRLTGFSRAEVMQRPAVCDFLHGPMTSPHAVAALRDALATGVEKHFEILYYRKDGEYLIYRLHLHSRCTLAECSYRAYRIRGGIKVALRTIQSLRLHDAVTG